MRGAVERNIPSRLRERRGVGRMSVRDAADLLERAIEFDVRGRVGRRAKITLDDFAVKVDDDHILDGHGIVRHARRFDDDQARLAVDFAHVAPVQQNESVLNERFVGLKYSEFDIF